jgi:hypothetical protein
MLDKDTLVKNDLDLELPDDPILAMEHASFNGLNERLEELIDLHINSSNPLHQEWARVYRLFYQRSKVGITPEHLVKSVQYQNSDHPEMFIAYRLLHAYGSYDQREFGVLHSIFKIILEEIEKIKESNLESFYRFRLGQLLANIYFRQNELDKAREQSQIIINDCHTHSFVASAYHTLGLSYLYEDYDAGMLALENSLQLYDQHNQKNYVNQLTKSIVFFNNYWGIDKNYLIFSNQNRDIHERAHYEVRKGNKVKAQEILNKIDFDSLSVTEKGFHHFYKGLALDDIDLLFKSIESFKKIEDKFAANMARLELYRRGERQAAIEAAYN